MPIIQKLASVTALACFTFGAAFAQEANQIDHTSPGLTGSKTEDNANIVNPKTGLDHQNELDSLHLKKVRALSKKNYEEAIECVNQEIQLCKGGRVLELLYVDRADIWRDMNKMDECIKDFSTAISLNPKRTAWYIERAQVYRDLKSFDKAITDCDRALSTKPDNVRAYEIYELRSECNEKAGRKIEAIKDAKRAYEASFLSFVEEPAHRRLVELTGTEPQRPESDRSHAVQTLEIVKKLESLPKPLTPNEVSHLTSAVFKKLPPDNLKKMGDVSYKSTKAVAGCTYSLNLGDGTDLNYLTIWIDDQKCFITPNDIVKVFGQGRLVPESTEGCLRYPPFIVYDRPWGSIDFMLNRFGSDTAVGRITFVAKK